MKARFSQLMGAATVLAIAAPQPDANAGDIFLKLSNLPGDSTSTKHKDEIEIESFSMGQSRPFSLSGAVGTSASKPTFADVNVQGRLSSASPKLALFCASGTLIPTATLSIQKATTGGKAEDYYQVTLTDVHVTSISTEASDGNGRPLERFSLSFSKMLWVYKPSVADNKTSAADVKAVFDIAGSKSN